MKINTLLKELDRLNIPKDKMAITSSGPLGIRNLREIGDLDIIVLPEIWDKLTTEYPISKNGNFESIYINNIQVLGEGSWFTDSKFGSVEEDIRDADVIDGNKYVKIDKILRIKKLKNRLKDIEDVKIIEKYMESKETRQV